MKKAFCFILAAFFLLALAVNLYAKDKSVSPWCTPPLSLGMSKAAVIDSWGEPDEKKPAGTDEVGLPKETWVYKTEPPTHILAKHNPVCTAFYLTFTGDSLTDYKAANEDKQK